MAQNFFRDRTLLHLAEHISNKYSVNGIRDVLIDLELTTYDEWEHAYSSSITKKENVLTLLRRLRSAGRQTDIIKLVKRTIEGANSVTVEALQLEGWDLSHFGIAPLAEPFAEPAVEENTLIGKLRQHNMNEVITLLEQSYDNYVQGHWEASNAMTRSALESLIKVISEKIALNRCETIQQGTPRFGYQPADFRNYLKATNFVDGDEFELLRTFYGYASSDGSHAGLSDQTDARLRRFVAVGICLFYLEKFETGGY